MKVNFDGMRLNLADDIRRLRKAICDNFEKEEDIPENIIDSFDAVMSSVGVMCCLFDDNDPEDVNDLSSELENNWEWLGAQDG